MKLTGESFIKTGAIAAALCVAGCNGFTDCTCDPEAKSPDGRNAIRISVDPLSYEVVRDGVAVVSKTEIGMKVNGKCLAKDAAVKKVTKTKMRGSSVKTPVYKKAQVCLEGNGTFVDFGDWGLDLVARNDGVAYRFVTKMPGKIKVDAEKASLALPDKNATCWHYYGNSFGCEESVPSTLKASEIATDGKKKKFVYLPFVYSVGGKTVAVTESDVRNYPVWNLVRPNGDKNASVVSFGSLFAGWPLKRERVGGWGKDRNLEKGGRWVRVNEHADYLVETDGSRTFPWRTFILADSPSKICEADIVYALAASAEKGSDFSWVKPGKVAWDWWNAFDNQGEKDGCNTKTYFKFVDFAAKTGVEYVILDEGWSESLNIWKFHPNVDVPAIIDYASKKGVGIILWMAWAQVCGEEAKVAEHFSKLGAKGFKVDFMDRGDADVSAFLEKFAAECAKRKMLVDYHGVYRPTGLHRRYPNIVNYEGIHGLEQMKWFRNNSDFMDNDVKAFFCRLAAGPMDYTPGAMDNYVIGGYKGSMVNPGSVGTRCRQIAMMSMYEAPLQMLCDSPTKYEKNMESFKFMAATPVVWDDTVGLGGCPDSFAAVARRKGDTWYAAAITNSKGRDYELDTSFLKSGKWNAEIFRDAPDSGKNPANYVHETKTVAAGEKIVFKMAPGGGFSVRFTK
jgi:alpha-glucosidase